MKNLLSIILLAGLLLSFTTANKSVSITGTVIDQSSKSPLSFATITIKDAKTKAIVAGGITAESGEFELTVSTGMYDLHIEYLAFKNYLLENQEITADFDLAVIELVPDVALLEGVEVVEERSTIEYKLDKKVFNVGKDIVSKGGNITDILDNVPSVSVDAGGAISLRGNANVRILIDGKPSVLSANGGLEQLPADLVAQVEVITNPSARYEASGTAGIINVILKKNKQSGFGGSMQLSGGYLADHRANINMNYKKDKFNLFTNIGYRYSNYFGERTRKQTVRRNDIATTLNQRAEVKRNDEHFNFYIGGDYFINKKNTLTISYFKDLIWNTDDTDMIYNYSDASDQLDSVITQVENYLEPQNFNQLEIDYVKTFEKEGQKFTTSIVYDFWNDDENESLFQHYVLPEINTTTNIETRDIESSKDLLFQSDFVSPLKNDARFEAGFRGEIRRITSDYTARLNGDLLPQFDNLLNYDERIYGAYVQYGQKLNKFNYLLGLRTEFSDIGISDRDAEFSDDKEYIGLFPTAHLTYNFSEMLNVQLSYSRRINRPSFWQLNPFGGLSDVRNQFAGNPDLNPMYTDSYEIGLLKRWDKLTINPSIYFQHNTDFFQFITTVNESGFFFVTQVNLEKENRLGAEISTMYSPAKWLRLSAELNYYKFEQVGEYENVNYDTKDDNWSARLNSRLKLDQGWAMQGSFRYRGANQNGQSFTEAQHSLDFAVSKDLFKDKANLAFNCRNILDSRIETQTISDENYDSIFSGKRIGRRFSATFTYRLNRKKGERDRLPGN